MKLYAQFCLMLMSILAVLSALYYTLTYPDKDGVLIYWSTVFFNMIVVISYICIEYAHNNTKDK